MTNIDYFLVVSDPTNLTVSAYIYKIDHDKKTVSYRDTSSFVHWYEDNFQSYERLKTFSLETKISWNVTQITQERANCIAMMWYNKLKDKNDNRRN